MSDPTDKPSMEEWLTARGCDDETCELIISMTAKLTAMLEAQAATITELADALRRLDALIDFDEPVSAGVPYSFDDPSEINAAYARARAALAKLEAER